MPLHVQEVLRGESTRDDPINDPMRLADFKGLQGYDEAETKTINNELYVKGLPFDLDHEGVRQLFSKAGHRPKSVRILKDRKDKTRSLGFGFVRFKTEQDADAAMRALNGKQLTSDADKGAETKLVISKASAKGKARPMGSKAKKTDFDTQVKIRKMQLTFDPKNNKPVTSLERMPRAYRALADRNAKTKNQLSQELAKKAADMEEDEEGEEGSLIPDDRAQAALDSFLKEGGMIEDVDALEFDEEVRDGKAKAGAGSRTDEILYGGETEDSNGGNDWFFVDDDDDEALARIEDKEEERRNWEEYQRVQRMNRDNLRPDGETKPSGALRSGQKKIKTWVRDEDDRP